MAIAPSTWRPPWLETITPSMPSATARRGVVGVEDSLEHDRERRALAQEREVSQVSEGRE